MFRSTHAFLRAGTLLLALTGAGAAIAGSGSTAGMSQKLVSALQTGDYQAVDAVIAKHPGVADKLLPDGSTPLSWAVETQDPLMVRRLLVARARPDAATNPAASPLMLACEHGHAAILAMLLDAGADARRANAEGVTPLAACAGNAPSDIVARLIDAGAVVDAADVRGQTPLMWAAANGRIENLRLLLAHGADINAQTKDGFSPLFFAIKSGKPAMSMAVLEAGGNPDHVGPENTNAAQLAIYQKDYAFALKMIERGVDLSALDRNGHSLLAAAVFENQPELVRALLARGADPNQWTGESKVEWRYEPNFRNGEYKAPSKHPLLIAAEKGSPEVMQLLVDAGARTDVRMPDGTTVLHMAVSTGQLAPVEKALAIGIDANVVDKGGRTALHRAVRLRPNFGFQTPQIITALAKHGARADLRDERGKTAADLIEDRATDAVHDAFAAAFGTRTAQR